MDETRLGRVIRSHWIFLYTDTFSEVDRLRWPRPVRREPGSSGFEPVSSWRYAPREFKSPPQRLPVPEFLSCFNESLFCQYSLIVSNHSSKVVWTVEGPDPAGENALDAL